VPSNLAIERCVRFYMSEKRFRHTLGVRDTAVRLAKAYRCSAENAAVAALLHDVARDMPLERQQRLVLEGYPRFSCSSEVFRDPLLLHASAGSVLAREDFRVHDRNVLRSIELHTTGGPTMGVLEKVVFVADFIEPGRRFRGVRQARVLARRDLDEAVLYVYGYTLRYLLQKKRYICERSLMGYNELILQRGNGAGHGNTDKPNQVPNR
jgi:predicted HD superfamily hydrolase involved in NAD metabolism